MVHSTGSSTLCLAISSFFTVTKFSSKFFCSIAAASVTAFTTPFTESAASTLLSTSVWENKSFPPFKKSSYECDPSSTAPARALYSAKKVLSFVWNVLSSTYALKPISIIKLSGLSENEYISVSSSRKLTLIKSSYLSINLALFTLSSVLSPFVS